MSEGRADFGRVQGVLPHGEADGSDPVKIGGRAHTSLPTAEAHGDIVNTLHDKFGRLIIASAIEAVTADSTKGPKSVVVSSPVDTVVIASPAVGSSIRVSSIFASNINPTFSFGLSIKESGTARCVARLHLDGGGYVWSFEPGGWVLGNGIALIAALDATLSSAQVNVQYQVIATP